MERWREARARIPWQEKRNSAWPPQVYEVVPKKVNGADFEEEREPLRGVTMQNPWKRASLD